MHSGTTIFITRPWSGFPDTTKLISATIAGRPRNSALWEWGCLFQGQRYDWQDKRRGTPAFDLPPATFVNYLQNHDQVANTGFGLRVAQLTSPARLRAMTALWLLAPQTPLLFQGQEFAASTPFCYFLDSPPERAAQVAAGRMEFLSQFRSMALPEVARRLPDPADPLTFARCKLQWAEQESHASWYALHKDLLRAAARRAAVDPSASGEAWQPLSADALVVRCFSPEGDDRLLVANLDVGLVYQPAP